MVKQGLRNLSFAIAGVSAVMAVAAWWFQARILYLVTAVGLLSFDYIYTNSLEEK